MIPLRFFRDKTHVYVNNPDGTTKQMTIAEFESMLNGSGGDLPEHSSSNQGEVLSVDANGDLVWASLPPSGLSPVGFMVSGRLNNVSIQGHTTEEVELDDAQYLTLESTQVSDPIPFKYAVIIGVDLGVVNNAEFVGFYGAEFNDNVGVINPMIKLYNPSETSINVDLSSASIKSLLLN